MTAWMVLTKREPLQAAVRSGIASAKIAWKPAKIAAPPLRDPEVVCFVVVNRLQRPALVAVLYDPEYADDGFRAETNTTLRVDLTSMWARLKFADGKGSSGNPESTLKVPRVLAPSDLKLLKIRPPGEPKVKPLQCVSTLVHPELADLDKGQRKQVVEAGLGYDGRKLDAKRRLAPSDRDDGSFHGSLTIRRFEGAGGGYDILTYRGDSGSVFRAGTTKRVGRIVQGGLECDDPELETLLAASLRPAKAPKKTAKKKTSKKKTSKKK